MILAKPAAVDFAQQFVPSVSSHGYSDVTSLGLSLNEIAQSEHHGRVHSRKPPSHAWTIGAGRGSKQRGKVLPAAISGLRFMRRIELGLCYK